MQVDTRKVASYSEAPLKPWTPRSSSITFFRFY